MHGKYSIREKIEEYEEKMVLAPLVCISMLFLFPLNFHEDAKIEPDDLIRMSATLLSTQLFDPPLSKSENHRLEKTSKIIKSNHPPNTTMPATPYPEVSHLHVF